MRMIVIINPYNNPSLHKIRGSAYRMGEGQGGPATHRVLSCFAFGVPVDADARWAFSHVHGCFRTFGANPQVTGRFRV